jgi:uncharacterized RDD family membrane protein YckC
MTPAENGVEKRVGFGARLAAALIDIVIVAIVGFGAGATIGGILGGGLGRVLDGPSGDAAAAGTAAGAVLGAIAAFGGFVFLYSLIEAFTGASPGKMVLGLKVGTAGGRRGWAALYVKRWAIKYSGTLLGLLGAVPGLHVLGLLAPPAGLAVFIGCFLVLGDKRQSLHDLGAATAVFRKTDLAV